MSCAESEGLDLPALLHSLIRTGEFFRYDYEGIVVSIERAAYLLIHGREDELRLPICICKNVLSCFP